MSDLTIVCISDLDGFAAKVYDYVYPLLEKQTSFDAGSDMQISRESVQLEGEEIRVDPKSHVPRVMVKWALESFLQENKAEFKDYGVVEFGDSFTIGRILPASEMEMQTCEICGYFTPYREELQTHRMTHFGV